MNDNGSESENGDVGEGTLYALAGDAMRTYIGVYLRLVEATNGLSQLAAADVADPDSRLVLLAGLDSPLDPATTDPEAIAEEFERRRAVPFDVEMAVTRGVYTQLRERVSHLIDRLDRDTSEFRDITPDYICEHPEMLPIFQRLADISSKSELKRRVGSVSDNAVSTTAATKLAQLIRERRPQYAARGQLIQSIEPTLEGIVRDLVGRVLLESIVANALDADDVPYQREKDYDSLSGVVYDFRADFVVPNAEAPLAFVEVRKSSSRHASLYAKDKMFSAINWKGRHQDLLAVLVVDGPWTSETLRVMAGVFDYVVPLSASPRVAEVIKAYIEGDRSKLRWLIEFSIKAAT